MILNSLVASAQHDGAHRQIRIWVLPILEHVRVLERFPKSQYRPSIIESSTTINYVPTRPVNRWNFRKADWAKFTDRLNTAANKIPSPTSEPNTAYKAWCSAILSAAKKTIPRGCRKGLIPAWDEECQQLYDQFTRAEPGAIANVKAD